MKKIRTAAQILLPLILLFSVLSSCGSNADALPEVQSTSSSSASAESTATTKATTAATTASEKKTEIPQGYEFTIFGEPGSYGEAFAPWTGITERSMNGNKYNAELLAAYEDLEAELGIVITFSTDVSYEDILANASAGKATADFVHLRHSWWIPLAVNGYLLPLNSDTFKNAGFDVNDPGTIDLTMTNASKGLDGENVWAANFSGKYYAMPWGYGMAFNKALCDAAGYTADSLYELVRRGEWTWEKFEEIAAAVTDTETGVYGYMVNTNAAARLVSGTSAVVRDSSGRWVPNADSDSFIAAAKKLYSDITANDWSRPTLEGWSGRWNQDFYEGKMAFCTLWSGDFGSIDEAVNVAVTFDYGFLPLPKSSGEEGYVNWIPDLNGFCCEAANKDAGLSAYIMGRIAAILNDPEEYPEAVAAVMRDRESVEMVTEYMLPNTAFDPTRLSMDLGSLTKAFRSGLAYASDVEAYCSQYASDIQTELDKIFN